MPEFEQDGYQGFWIAGRRVRGDEGLAVILKRRWSIDGDSGTSEPAQITLPVQLAPELSDSDDPAGASVRRPSEIALHKPRVDVLVYASAYAPGGQATEEFDVSVHIEGVLERSLRVIGPRIATWRPPKKAGSSSTAKGKEKTKTPALHPPPVLGRPEACSVLPLRYEFAYGGRAPMILDPGVAEAARAAAGAEGEPHGEDEPSQSEPPRVSYAANPAGRGFCISPLEEAVEGLDLPCIEDPTEPLEAEDLVRDLSLLDLGSLPAAPGFAPYGAGWFPRAGLAGVMPWDVEQAEAARDKVIESLDPDDPSTEATRASILEMEIPVMQPGWFQEAHPSLQVDHVAGDERVSLVNLTREGELVFRLPGRHPLVHVDFGDGETVLPVRLDTVSLDLEDENDPAVELIWRGWHPLPSLDAVGRLEPRVEELEQAEWLGRQRDARRVAEGSGEDVDTTSEPEEDHPTPRPPPPTQGPESQG